MSSLFHGPALLFLLPQFAKCVFWHLRMRSHGRSKGNQAGMFLLDWSYCDTSALPLSGPGRRLKISLSWALFWVLWKCSITVGLHQQNALLWQLLCQWWLTPSLALRNPAVSPASLCCGLGAPPFREDVRRAHASYLLLQSCYLPRQLWKC